MSASVLDAAAVDDWLAAHPDWERDGGDAIRRAVQCPSFPDAISLVDRVAVDAEAANHHPDIDIRWRTVTFTLSTHSEGGLTELDLRLAEKIDGHAAG